MFGFTWEIRALVSKSFVQRKTVVTKEYKIKYKALEKVCTKIHEIKKAHICSGFLFSEITTNDRDGGVQISEKIFTDINVISQQRPRVGVAMFAHSYHYSQSNHMHLFQKHVLMLRQHTHFRLIPLKSSFLSWFCFWEHSSSLSTTTLIPLSLFPLLSCLAAPLSPSMYAIPKPLELFSYSLSFYL